MLENLFERLGWTLLHSLWQGAAVAAVLAAVLWLMHRRSASGRYAASCVALLLMLALPVGTFILLDRPVRAVGQPVQDVQTFVPMEEIPSGPLAPIAPGVPRVPSQPYDGPIAVEATSSSGLDGWLTPALLQRLSWVWLAGVVAMGAWHLGGWIALVRIQRDAEGLVDEAWQKQSEALARRLGVRRAVRLAESPRVGTPLVIGVFRPMVLMPVAVLNGLTVQQVESILAHELAHVRRHDYLVNLLQTVAETLLFFSPAAWWVSRRIREERESCCDELAVAVTGQRAMYARALAALAEKQSTAPRLALAASDPPLVRRIRRVLGGPAGRSGGWSRSVVVGLAAVVVAGGLLVGGRVLSPAAAADAEAGEGDEASVEASVETSDETLDETDTDTAFDGATHDGRLEALRPEQVEQVLQARVRRDMARELGEHLHRLQEAADEMETDELLEALRRQEAAIRHWQETLQSGGAAAGRQDQPEGMRWGVGIGGGGFGRSGMSGARRGDGIESGMEGGRRGVGMRGGMEGGMGVGMGMMGGRSASGRADEAEAVRPEDLVAEARAHRIMPGDLVAVSIAGIMGPNIETTVSKRVSELGQISLPLIGDVEVAGMTEAEAQRRIADHYRAAQIVQNPAVSVTVVEARSQVFSVLGLVQNPGQYAIPRAEFRLLEALALAGGFREGAEVIVIMRPQPAEEDRAPRARRIEVPVSRLMRGEEGLNLVIRPGDTVLVPAEAAQRGPRVRWPGEMRMEGDTITIVPAPREARDSREAGVARPRGRGGMGMYMEDTMTTDPAPAPRGRDSGEAGSARPRRMDSAAGEIPEMEMLMLPPIRVVVHGEERIEVDGQAMTWEEFGEHLAAMPAAERAGRQIEVAAGSAEVTVGEYFAAVGRAQELAGRFGMRATAAGVREEQEQRE